MLIWLPPSESKLAPRQGPLLDLDSLTLPGLRTPRERLIEALAELGSGPRAAEVLGLGPASAALARANEALLTSACAPASELFTGVLFDALDFASLTDGEQARLRRCALVFSGLFGVVALDDALPDHRLAMGVRLPGIGGLAGFWRSALDEELRVRAEGETVIDARSGPYAAACPAPWARIIRIQAVRERAGARASISHDAKRWRGLVVRALAGLAPEAGADEVLDAVARMAGRVAFTDAKGVPHAIGAVEIGDALPASQGGSVRELVLVTD